MTAHLLTVEEFGAALLLTGDLDPVYVAIHNTMMPPATLHRLFIAYICFYHLGVAAQLAQIRDPKKYWEAMMVAAINEGERPDGSKPWPRGAERRHFRAQQAILPVRDLISKYKTATDAVYGFVGVSPKKGQTDMTYGSVSRAAMSHRGFGPWIAFKIADMSERVLGYDVDFSDCHLGIYKDPRQGAAVAYLGLTGNLEGLGGQNPWDYPITDSELQRTVDEYVRRFQRKKFYAPAAKDQKHVRLVNVQEVETIFCKYKSYLKGSYPLGKDTKEIGHGLEGWGDLAEQLRKGLPHGKAA